MANILDMKTVNFVAESAKNITPRPHSLVHDGWTYLFDYFYIIAINGESPEKGLFDGIPNTFICNAYDVIQEMHERAKRADMLREVNLDKCSADECASYIAAKAAIVSKGKYTVNACALTEILLALQEVGANKADVLIGDEEIHIIGDDAWASLMFLKLDDQLHP